MARPRPGAVDSVPPGAAVSVRVAHNCLFSRVSTLEQELAEIKQELAGVKREHALASSHVGREEQRDLQYDECIALMRRLERLWTKRRRVGCQSDDVGVEQSTSSGEAVPAASESPSLSTTIPADSCIAAGADDDSLPKVVEL